MTNRVFNGSFAVVWAIIFLLDISQFRGWPLWIFYAFCILLADWWKSEIIPWRLAAISTVLTSIAFAISYSVGAGIDELPNRLFGIALFWLTAAATVKIVRAENQNAQLANELASKRKEFSKEPVLNEYESRYKVFLDHASDAVFVFDNSGKVVDANRQAYESLGRTPEELIGQYPPYFANVGSKDFVGEVTRKLNQGQKVSFDGVHRHKDGSEFPVEVRICPFQSNGQRLALGIARNITDRKKIEEDLRSSERRFRELADAIPQIVSVTRPDGYVAYLNARASEFTGVPIDELLGEQWMKFIHPDDLDDADQTWIRVLESGVTEDVEVRFRRHDGEYRWHICRQYPSRNAQGEIEVWYGTCTDIESQKRIEAALRDSEQRFVGFMQHFPGFAWFKDMAGRYVFANTSFEQIVGASGEQVCGKADTDLFPAENAAEFRDSDLQAIESPTGIKLTQTLSQADGMDHLFLVTKFPIRGEDGTPVLVGGMAIDITEQKQTEFTIAGQNRIMERIATGSPLADILELIVDLVADQIPNTMCSIYLFDTRENRLKFGADANLPEEYSKAIDGMVVGPNIGSCGATVFRREAVIVSDVTVDDLWIPFRDLAARNGIRSCWSVPIFSRSGETNAESDRRVLGTFAIYKSNVWEPGPAETKMVATATYLASVAIEREEDVKSLRESEERYRSLVDYAPVGIYVNIDNKFAYVNDATCRLMGADSKEQLLGTSILDRFPGEILPTIRTRIDQMLNLGESVSLLAHRYVRLDGSEVHVETMGIPIQFDHRAAIQVLINDVTERKVAEEKLNATAERLAMLFRSSPVGICISTMAEGIVIEVNEIYVKMAGYQNDEIIGNRTIEFGQWPDPEKRDELVRELKKHGSVKNWEVGFRRKDGSFGYSLRSFERLELDGKDCILTMVSDITARKEIDEELRVSRQRLEILSRQLITTQETERRHLARELHDEISQIMTAIKINLSRAQKIADPAIQSALEENVLLVDQAISQVRNLSLSLRPPQLDQLGLVAALHWVVNHQARIGRFKENLDADIGDLQVSDDIAIACFRVTQEALTNAVRHARPQQVHVKLKVDQEDLLLSIEDDGVGFDVNQARQKATRGQSLGLLSMQERVNLLGGRLIIDSKVGRGTRIMGQFPIENASRHETTN